MNQEMMRLSRRVKAIEAKMVTKEELEALIDTIEILSSPEAMEKLEAARRDIKQGRTTPVRSVKEILAE